VMLAVLPSAQPAQIVMLLAIAVSKVREAEDPHEEAYCQAAAQMTRWNSLCHPGASPT